jgi:hypothetical protein
MSRYLSTDIYSRNGELSLVTQNPDTGIQYLAQLQNKFGPCKIMTPFCRFCSNRRLRPPDGIVGRVEMINFYNGIIKMIAYQ